MKLKELSLDELESMTYDEIACQLLLESGKKEKLLKLYEKICKLLKLDFETEKDNIVDFFEILSTNKKFVMLKNGYWDLQINHKLNSLVEDIIDDEEMEEDEEETEDEKTDTEDDDIFYEADEDDDTVEDDLAELAVVDEDDESN